MKLFTFAWQQQGWFKLFGFKLFFHFIFLCVFNLVVLFHVSPLADLFIMEHTLFSEKSELPKLLEITQTLIFPFMKEKGNLHTSNYGCSRPSSSIKPL